MKSKTSHIIEKEKGMNVPGIVFASEESFNLMKKDKTIEQIKNVAMLPGIIGYSIALPDAHQGYGFPIGGVAAFDLEKGIISPGGVGYDINCGVRMLKTNLKKSQIEKSKELLLTELSKKIPSGVGRGSPFQISKKQLDEILKQGSKWFIEKGYGVKEDLEFCEENGCLNADSSLVSDTAKKRGIGQLGTLGAGNHFLEIQYVEKIFNEREASVFGLSKNQIVILIHCGSRGLGHQVASDYIKKMEKEYKIKNLPDRELINAPIKSKLGKEYFLAMNSAANFAFANRQLISHGVREVFKKIFPKSKIDLLYDVCHNIAKIETHKINGKNKEICVHRKGATRSFGKDRKEIPKKYNSVGQPVFLPGSMGTFSYVLSGTKESEKKSWGSCAHGAGRKMSRISAIRELNEEIILKNLNENNILIKSQTKKALLEEAPEAYKDVNEIVKIIEQERLGKIIVRTKPLVVLKG